MKPPRKIGVILLSIIILFTIWEVDFASARTESAIYTPKETMIQHWINLVNDHKDIASYEVVGKSIQGQNIYLFKIGNPNGGAVMYDGYCHGAEDGGTELEYKFAKWLCESNEELAQRIRTRNYNLFIPIINVDILGRMNARRSYKLEDGTVIETPYGVNLNRNGVYGFGKSGSGDPNDSMDYRGLYGGSEPETQAWRNACAIYKPKIYLNTHVGADELLLYAGTGQLEEKIISIYTNVTQQMNVTGYRPRKGGGGGYIHTDANGSFGASGWLIEFCAWEDLPSTLDEFITMYYPRAFALFVAFNQAVEIQVPTQDITPPIADAGLDQTVSEDTLMTFDGSASTDNIGITTYTWTFTDGTPKTLTGINPKYIFANPGTYVITLKVSDAAGNFDTDNVTITVKEVTSPKNEARVNITLSIEDERIDVGKNATIFWSGFYEFDNSTFAGTIVLNDTQTTYDTVGKHGYRVASITDPKYGTTTFATNEICCVWDNLKIVEGGATNVKSEVGKSETIWFKAIYEYDYDVFDDLKGVLYVNGSAMSWSEINNRWEYSYTVISPGLKTFGVSGFYDSEYNLEAINDQAGIQTITFWGSSSITISLDTTTTYTGYRVKISGELFCGQASMPQSNLLFSYSVTGGKTWNDITSVRTEFDGSYSVQWMPTASGNFLVRVEWSGNESLYLRGSQALSSWVVIPLEKEQVLSVISNSTVTEFAFNSTIRELRLTVSGPSGTTGYTNITIAKPLVTDISELKIYLDGNQINYDAISIGDFWLLHFSYQHSVHGIVVKFGPIIAQPFIETCLGIVTIAAIISLIFMILISLKRQR